MIPQLICGNINVLYSDMFVYKEDTCINMYLIRIVLKNLFEIFSMLYFLTLHRNCTIHAISLRRARHWTDRVDEDA